MLAKRKFYMAKVHEKLGKPLLELGDEFSDVCGTRTKATTTCSSSSTGSGKGGDVHANCNSNTREFLLGPSICYCHNNIILHCLGRGDFGGDSDSEARRRNRGTPGYPGTRVPGRNSQYPGTRVGTSCRGEREAFYRDNQLSPKMGTPNLVQSQRCTRVSWTWACTIVLDGPPMRCCLALSRTCPGTGV
eukprot:1954237-Rhodomonas_salina.1